MIRIAKNYLPRLVAVGLATVGAGLGFCERIEPMATTSTFLQDAEYYVSLGWKVVPVYAALKGVCTCHKRKACGDPGKHPIPHHGHLDATTDMVTIRKWARQWPNANIGIATGKPSSVVVLDLDPRNGGDEGFRQLRNELGTIPPCPKVQTGGGGWHYYFRRPDLDDRFYPPDLADGLNVKADDGMIVAPNSRHESGKRYEWVLRPTEIDLPELPEAWLARMLAGAHSTHSEHRSHKGAQGNTGSRKGTQDNPSSAEKKLATCRRIDEEKSNSPHSSRNAAGRTIAEVISKNTPTGTGQRHRRLFDLARALKSFPQYEDSPPDAAIDIVRKWHTAALPRISTPDWDSSWWDFCETWEAVKYPEGKGVVEHLVERAAENIPEVAKQFESDGIKLLVSLCRQAQLHAGDKPFPLAGRLAGDLLGIEPGRAAAWLRGLCRNGILRLEKEGSLKGRRASEYRYLPDLEN